MKANFIFLNMNSVLIAIIVVGLILITLVMLQSKGTGLSIVPGSNDFGKFERRGPEKTLHIITISLVVIFIALCIGYYFFA